MKIEKKHIVGIIAGLVFIIADLLLFRHMPLFYFLIGVAFLIMALPFLVSTMMEVGREKEKEDMFLEFSRNLVENVKSGTPISKSIINLKDKNFGSLTPHVQKLANQIAIGIPVRQAFSIFASDINNKIISRSVTLISEAEQAGGEIDTILESVAKSVSEIEDVKKEQKAAIYNLVIQGYIIFLIFIIIMLVTEFKIIPMTINLGGGPSLDISGFKPPASINAEQFSMPLLVLIIVQGFFAGLIIGKLSEGTIKAGLKHSFILVFLAYLITTGVRALVPVAVAAV